METAKIVTGKEMQEIDRISINKIGIPSLVLMERAALSVYEEIRSFEGGGPQPGSSGDGGLQPPSTLSNPSTPVLFKSGVHPRILILTGGGNNGADGLALARMLLNHNYPVDLYCVLPSKCSEEYQTQLDILKELEEYAKKQGNPLPLYWCSDFAQIRETKYDCIVDALFGTGLSRDIEGERAEILSAINKMDAWKLALDIPSGIDATSGKTLGVAFHADTTVTFGYAKTGQLYLDGANACGTLIVKDIGFPNIIAEKIAKTAFSYFGKPNYPKRNPQGNKGTNGKVTVIAGSETVYGAAYLSATAAYRSGCGLVEMITHEKNRISLQQALPEALLHTYETKEEALGLIEKAKSWADLVLIGPGIGTDEIGQSMVNAVLSFTQPVVLDADAVTLFAKLDLIPMNRQIIFTPHMKEMERLSGISVSELKILPWEHAKHYVDALAKKIANANNNQAEVVCVLKDARTVVASNKKQKIYINTSGNDGMATGGSGDVLAGMIAGFCAQNRNEEDLHSTLSLAVYTHGLAGDLAAEKHSRQGMLAGDMLEEIGDLRNPTKKLI